MPFLPPSAEILPQLIVFATIIGMISLFIWNRFRYDLVALLALLTVVLAGIIEPNQALSNFGHPAVIIVASMFIVSQAVIDSGLIEVITRRVSQLKKYPSLQILVLCLITALASGFINNVGALAIMIPVAVHLARRSKRSPALYLMPLAFSSHLGGFLTLIASPRNLIVSSFRADSPVGEPFGFFDFALVGTWLAIVGLLFLAFVGWRTLPNRHTRSVEDLFPVGKYVTEARVPESSPLVGQPVKTLSEGLGQGANIVSIDRQYINLPFLSGFESVEPGDIILIQAEPNLLNDLIESYGLELTGQKSEESSLSPTDESTTMEAVISPMSTITGQTWSHIALPTKFGVNLLAIARYGETIKKKLDTVTLHTGDILLLSGRRESVNDSVTKMKLYPLAERELLLGRKLTIPLALLIFITAIALAVLNWLPTEIIFMTAAVIIVLLRLVPISQAYSSVQWSVLVMLGSMLTLGQALELTGGDDTVANWLQFAAAETGHLISPGLLALSLTLLTTILISNFVSVTTSAVVMAPIAIALAHSIGISLDPLLMAVAVGASFAFLTPASHESNAMVLEAGGYTTWDYVKIGLPLQIIILILGLILIPIFWPL